MSSTSLQFWEDLATEPALRHSGIVFELFNEPFGFEAWRNASERLEPRCFVNGTGCVYAGYQQGVDVVRAAGAEPHSAPRDEIAAANMYTQDGWAGSARSLFRPLNAALRSEARTDVKVYWGYIRLLQHALFKLPKDESGTLCGRIKLDWRDAR